MNSRKQGDVGTAFAIAYFVSKGYTVSLPISDSQPYDLIIETKGKCQRVQAKTCFKRNKFGSYEVQLRTVSNTRGKKLTVRKLSKKNFELMYVVDGVGNHYLIPSAAVHDRNSITTTSMNKWKVNPLGAGRVC